MSTKSEPINWSSAGWAFLGLLSLFAFAVTLVGQFFGMAWFWPWIFMALFWFLVVKTSKVRKENEEKPVEEEYKLPHLVSVPGQYGRKPCDNPEWILIPTNRDYEIHCATHQVRNKHTGDIVQPGHDPRGIDNRAWIELGTRSGRIHYVPLEDIVAMTLGRGHTYAQGN